MTTKLQTACLHPACSLYAQHRGYCNIHATTRRRLYDASAERQQTKRFYRQTAWSAIRRAVLARQPTCRHCGAPASEVDHIVPLRRGGTNALSNLQALCRSCHSRKSITETKGLQKISALRAKGGPMASIL